MQMVWEVTYRPNNGRLKKEEFTDVLDFNQFIKTWESDRLSDLTVSLHLKSEKFIDMLPAFLPRLLMPAKENV